MSTVDLVRAAIDRSNDYRPGIQRPTQQRSAAVSVVIPYYQGVSLDLTLHALAAAHHATGMIKELIVVDDGSPCPVPPQMPLWAADLATCGIRTIVVRHERNMGRPHARNTGIAFTDPSSTMLLFLDQDMLLDPHLLTQGHALLQSNGAGLVTGFRTTLGRQQSTTARSAAAVDWRHQTSVDEHTIDVTVDGCGQKVQQEVQLYRETKGFRALGVGPDRAVACWDLPSIVVSHSLLACRDLIVNIGGFPEWVKGWGCEDMALGLSVFASGGLIMAAGESCSTQIAHAPLSGSTQAQWTEFRANHQRYRSWARRATIAHLAAPTLQKRASLLFDSERHLRATGSRLAGAGGGPMSPESRSTSQREATR